MGIVISKKELSTNNIKCGDSFKIILSLSAAPDLINAPKDIVLVLDRSGSMQNEPLEAMKKGVCSFIDIIDKESDGFDNEQIGNGNKIGIVSFSSSAVIEKPLSTDVKELKTAVNNLRYGGATNHEDAFRKGIDVLDVPSSNEKILIIFTDGESNKGQEGFALAEEAKAKGIKVYALGYGDEKRLNVDALNKWASAPSSAYTLVTPDINSIESTFTDLLTNIKKTGATNINITDTVSDCFKIVSVDNATKGTGEIVSEHSVRWNISELGKTESEGATFSFTVQHVGSCSGDVEVNKSIVYTDSENNSTNFPSPIINVACENPVVIEECPKTHDITVGACEDYIDFNAEDLEMGSLGRVLQLTVTLKNICPNKRVALASILTEEDSQGNEYSRGMKTMVIPAHSENTCKDIIVRCIKFVIPEELDEKGDKNSLCGTRKFKARFIANYIDSDYYCCENI